MAGVRRAIAGREEEIERTPQHLARRITEDPLGAAIEVHDPLLRVHGDHRIGGDLQDPGELRLRRAELLLHMDAPRQIVTDRRIDEPGEDQRREQEEREEPLHHPPVVGGGGVERHPEGVPADHGDGEDTGEHHQAHPERHRGHGGGSYERERPPSPPHAIGEVAPAPERPARQACNNPSRRANCTYSCRCASPSLSWIRCL